MTATTTRLQDTAIYSAVNQGESQGQAPGVKRQGKHAKQLLQGVFQDFPAKNAVY